MSNCHYCHGNHGYNNNHKNNGDSDCGCGGGGVANVNNGVDKSGDDSVKEDVYSQLYLLLRLIIVL